MVFKFVVGDSPARRRRKAGLASLVALGLVAGAAGHAAYFGAAAAATADPAAYKLGPFVMEDYFDRTRASGLGSAPRGGPYTVTPGSVPISVGNGEAKIPALRPGQSFAATVDRVSASDVEVRNKLSLPSIGSVNGLWDGVTVRGQRDGQNYRVKVSVGDGGRVVLHASRTLADGREVALKSFDPKINVSSGNKVRYEARIAGTQPVRITARTWVEGRPKPSWQLVTSDAAPGRIVRPGSVGLWSYESRRGRTMTLTHTHLTALSLIPPSSGRTPSPTTTSPRVTTTSPGVTTTTAPPAAPTGSPGVTTGLPGSGALGLDNSGRTIPDTNYAIPSGAIFMAPNGKDSGNGTSRSPVKTLNRATAIVPNGGTIVMRGGTYRDWTSNASGSRWAQVNKSVTIQAYPHEKVWLDGTDVIPRGDWRPAGGGRWYINHSTPQFCDGQYYSRPLTAQSKSPNTGPCAHWDASLDPANPMAVDPQMVFVNGVKQPQAKTLAEATGGKFFYDWSARRLYVSVDPSQKTIEVTKRPLALVLKGSNWKLRGIGIRRYATNEYSNVTNAAVYGAGPGGLVENVVFTQNAGQGLYLNPINAVVRNSVFAYNGFTGMGANGHSKSTGQVDGLLVERSVFNANNDEAFGTRCSVSCASSNVKLAHMNGFTFRFNIFENATKGRANGVWCDLKCRNGVFVYNIARNNATLGIFYEVSDGGIIASNLIVGNGAQGIKVSSSNTKIFNNTLVDNLQGIEVYDDRRSPGVGGWSDVYDTRNNAMGNNIVVGRNYSLKAGTLGSGAPNTHPGQFFRSLDYDAFYQSNGPGLGYADWTIGYNAGRANTKSLAAFTAATGFERHGIFTTGPAPFVDASKGNYAVKPGSSSYRSGGPLPADVAKALGVSAAAGQNRGAFAWPRA